MQMTGTQSSATDKHQSRAVDMPQRSGQTCCNNTEPDMSQDKKVQVPLLMSLVKTTLLHYSPQKRN